MTLTILFTFPSTLDATVHAMAVLAAFAAIVNALELWQLRPAMADHGVWRASILAREWGMLAPLLRPRGFTMVLLLQLMAALLLIGTAGTSLGVASTALLATTSLLAAMRFRGTVNGGSDAMLFTVLGGLTLAQLPAASLPVREAGVLYVAAQLTLSYLRAGLVKVRARGWWTGHALQDFLSLPAYGAPSWMQLPERTSRRAGGRAVQALGLSVMLFECSAWLAWTSPVACLVFIVAAVTFHLGAAAVFGLNRFFLAWGAALPSLWYAVHRVSH